MPKVALVTGGSRGIGHAVVDALTQRGVSVAFCARYSSGGPVKPVALSSGAVSYAADVSSTTEVMTLVTRVEADLGPIAILVNNAAAPAYGDVLTVTDDMWQAMLDVKLLGYVRTIRAVLPGMVKRRYGRIVNIAGSSATRPKPGVVAIGAANAAIINLTRSVARGVAREGVTVNAISPGPTGTERLLASDHLAEVESAIPIGRLVRPEEVAFAVAMLCEDGAGAITGACLQVDGGVSI